MEKFTPGQIVYVSDDKKDWFITIFIEKQVNYKTANSINAALNKEWTRNWKHCLSIEDYEKMVNEPKDKQLCWCWNNDESHKRTMKFYDKENKVTYYYDGKRHGNRFENYEPIPREEYPQWAIEAEKTLEG